MMLRKTPSRKPALLTVLVVFALAAASRSFAAAAERAIEIREASLYMSPDASSQKLGNIQRGREVAIIEASGEWLHVLAAMPAAAGIGLGEDTHEREVTGWVRQQGIIRTSTPNGDAIIFGEAVDSEAEAQRRHGRKGAAQDAMRLYARMAEYFPKSPLAGEALFRAADIRWQLEKSDVMSRPSAREADPLLRGQMSESMLNEVRKKFPGTKWADLASFELLENKICGDWQGSSKCPEKEAGLYEDYTREHPSSPKAAEALYEAAWRRAALMQIYRTEGKANRIDEARNRALQLTQQITAQFAQSDFAPRAQALAYKIQQNIPTYGSAGE